MSKTELARPPASFEDKESELEAARESLTGRRKGIRALLPFLGPAFISSIAYIDPGNFATNIQSGAQFGYKLLWVVVLANLMAMLLQNLSAKLGIATGRNLPELCRDHYPKWLSYVMWLGSEIAAMATDVAEFLGATLAINLLFGIPMLAGAGITAVVTYLVLLMEQKGFRPLEKFIAAFALFIGLCYLVETVLSRPDLGLVAYHSVVPWVGGRESIMLAVGVIGATVMPHALYLHSNLTKNRVIPQNPREALKIQRFSTIEIIIAMAIAGFVNVAMMYMAAATFNTTGHQGVSDLTTAYQTLTPILGAAAAGVFLASLLASGLSSSVVGTMAGQVIMEGFVGFTIPLWIRRVVTMLPTFIIIAMGIDPTQTLVVSQVILSLILPMPVLSLIYFSRRRDVMGVLANRSWVTALSAACAVVILALNVWLLYQVCMGK